ncbi:DNA alkylation repair protein, partial [Dehalococcoidia bacterium]|nr:DNA alkylation repair protein [Dehalococcoidia bacterium]MCL0104241.1 DNA alkylation repair protein [Dehalococcoidia bacterium]
MIDDVRDIIEKGIQSLNDALPEINNLASNDDWRKREDAATALVEISKKKEDEVVNEMILWAEDENPNIRRTASEGLRGVARRNPEKILPVIEKLKTDDSLYVRKSVAALLRAISKKPSWATAHQRITKMGVVAPRIETCYPQIGCIG